MGYTGYDDARGSRKQERSLAGLGIKAGIGLVGLILVLIFQPIGCITVPPGSVGIKINKLGSTRGVSDVATVSGFTPYNKYSTEIIPYPLQMQNIKWTASANEGGPGDESITFTSQDGAIINADISLSYHLEPSQVPAFYVQFRADKLDDFTDSYMRNVVRNAFNDESGKYTAEQIMGDNSTLLKAVEKQITSKLAPQGVIVDPGTVGFINAPRPPKPVTDSILSKIAAQQLALQKQNEVAQATADAQKRVAEAKGEADAKIAVAEGEAQANQKLQSSISPTLIEWRKLELQAKQIDKWDGALPRVTTGGSGSILLNVPGQ